MPELGQPVIVLSLALLVLGSGWIALRELRAHSGSRGAVLCLLLLWIVALALRLGLSPRTFLHEYYTLVAVPQSLAGVSSPHGNAGPALFNLAATLLGRPTDPEVILVTTAVVSSLAVLAVALLDLLLFGSWPRAICAAVLLCVLPQHLRFSAAEDMFVHAVTFGMWTLVLFVLYLRTRRADDAVVCALALSVAMQTRPEMLFFPAVLLGYVLLVEPRSWRVVVSRHTLLALLVLAGLLFRPLLDLHAFLSSRPRPESTFPGVRFYLDSLVLLDGRSTPAVYRWLLIVGLLWGLWRATGITVWVLAVFLGYSLFSRSLFDNPPYNLRSQILPTSFLVLIAAGVVPVWMAVWRSHRRPALAVGAAVLGALGASVIAGWQGFVTELRDQQLEWAFLQRALPQLPARGTLLWAGPGPTDMDAFPHLLLRSAGKEYQVVDARRVIAGELPWPGPDPHLLFYQGMHCHFAFQHEPQAGSMSRFCAAAHAQYALEPLLVEELGATPYSHVRYFGDGQGPFQIGFFRAESLHRR